MDFGEGGVGSGAHFNCGFMMSTERRELCLILFPTFYSPSISIGLSFSLPSPLSPAPSVPPLCSLIVCSLSLSLSHSWRLSLLSSHSSCCCCVRERRQRGCFRGAGSFPSSGSHLSTVVLTGWGLNLSLSGWLLLLRGGAWMKEGGMGWRGWSPARLVSAFG